MQFSKFLQIIKVKIDDWNIAAPATLSGFGIIGDNPVILRENFCGHSLAHNMIMPLSKDHVVYHTTGSKPFTLPPEYNLLLVGYLCFFS